ncbi:PepSY domain-containing protein [Diaphorobacter ruginosibacter]|uniref:PepSY domain-containing protein n=1 Tax=Diaphorobacter ruginosibacter TaxID=1715720 RepID=A0A7G9RVJ0_9BURK|nr:PepSY domain-containing protein [Diaphorobacter ruginosibacter]QNN59615.1 PepSY domain-containing protein [Diaphorobacter ruginosibacter]
MSNRTIKTWAWVHKWSSLICTVFMLLLCLTGLPLIFHHEIGHLLGTEVETPKMAPGTPHASLDKVLEVARAQHPDRVVQFASKDEDDDNLWFVTMTPTPDPTEDFRSVAIDARTAEVLAQPRFDEGFMYVMFKLHVDLFAGLPGKLFLGFMGLLLLVAIVSGVVLYAPFMRKLDFGTVRRDRRTRLKWLDLHNLLGVVTLVWLFVVGATGMINTWADLVIKYWQYDQLSALMVPYQGQPTVPVAERGSVQRSMEVAQAQAPHTKLSFIAFPGTAFSSPHHTTFFLKGNEPFTSKLLQPVLVDAKTAEVTAAPQLPWYLTALLVSQPLHFGDYGGMPMQIIWALLDIATIIVLGSGLYLWLKKGKTVPVPDPRSKPETETGEVPARPLSDQPVEQPLGTAS